MFNPKSLSFAAAALVVGLSAPAFAQSGDCTADADCPDGYTCETSEWEACPPCPVGENGETCDTSCETESYSYCQPPPPRSCDASNPCDGSDVCVTYTFESCSGGGSVRPACPPDEPCEEPEPEPVDETCTSETESYCVPPYAAPCETDSDCGGGFTCEAQEICECSGSSGSGGSVDPDPGGEPGTDPGGEEPAPDGGSCSCEPSGENYCQLIETPCSTDADCAGDLKCTDGYAEDRPAIACSTDEPCPDEEPPPAQKYCAPEDFYWGYGGGNYDDAVAEASGNEGEVRGSEREEFFPVDGTDGDGTGSKSKPSACATGLGAEPAGSAMLLFLGLAFARLRRRR